jgi:hypothetical protein
MLFKFANSHTNLAYGSSSVKAVINNNRALWSKPGFAWNTYDSGGVFFDIMRGIVYGDNQFVAVSTVLNNESLINRCGVSPDGIIWSWHDAAAASSWEDVAYGKGIYVSVASSSSSVGLPRSMYSYDGKIWRSSNISTTGVWRSVIYANNQFLAAGSSAFSVSSDGISWNTPTNITFGARSVAYGNGIYVAVSNSGTNRIATSTNGTTWTTRLAPAANAWYGVVFHNGLFIACATSGTQRIMTSPDGINWTLRNNSTGGFYIAAGDGCVVCSGGSVSTDGINWSNQILIPSMNIWRIAYGDGIFLAALFDNTYSSSTRHFAVSGQPKKNTDFYLDISERPRITQSTSTQNITSGDSNIVRTTSPTTVSDYLIQPRSLVGKIQPISLSISNTSILSTPNISGIATYLSAGTINVSGVSPNGQSVTRIIKTASSQSASRDQFVSYRSGSLGESIVNAVNNAISPVKTKTLFSTKNHTTSLYIRDTNVWTYNIIDLTSVSVWNSVNGSARCGTLISPRHIIYAAHYPLTIGSSLRFVDNNNNVITRQITNKLTAPNNKNYYPDYEIGILDSDVPNSITPAKFLPDNWTTKLTSIISELSLVPTIYTNQNEEVFTSDWVKDDGMIRCSAPTVQSRLDFFSMLIAGDSGHPCFIMVPGSNAPVILTVWTYGISGSGTSLFRHKTNINSLMTSLGGGYQLTEVDLSAFPSY